MVASLSTFAIAVLKTLREVYYNEDCVEEHNGRKQI